MPDISLYYFFCSEVSPKQASILCRAVIQIHEGEAFSFTYSPMKCAYLPTLVDYPTEFVRMLKAPSLLSPQGLGTTDSVLIRIMVARAEIDMLDIKTEFLKAYGKTLHSFIKVRPWSQGMK